MYNRRISVNICIKIYYIKFDKKINLDYNSLNKLKDPYLGLFNIYFKVLVPPEVY